MHSDTFQLPYLLEHAQLQPVVTRSAANPRIHNARFVPSGEPGVTVPLEILYDGELVGATVRPLKILPEVEPHMLKIREFFEMFFFFQFEFWKN